MKQQLTTNKELLPSVTVSRIVNSRLRKIEVSHGITNLILQGSQVLNKEVSLYIKEYIELLTRVANYTDEEFLSHIE